MGRLYRAGTDCCCGIFYPCLNRTLPSTLYTCFYREDAATGEVLPAFSFGCNSHGGFPGLSDREECESFFGGRPLAWDLFEAGDYRPRPGQTPDYAGIEAPPTDPDKYHVRVAGVALSSSYDPLDCFHVVWHALCHGTDGTGGGLGVGGVVREISTITPLYLVYRLDNAGANANDCANVCVVSEVPTCRAPALPDRWYCWQDYSEPLVPGVFACSKTSPGGAWVSIGGPYFSCEECQAVCGGGDPPCL